MGLGRARDERRKCGSREMIDDMLERDEERKYGKRQDSSWGMREGHCCGMREERHRVMRGGKYLAIG